LMGGGRAIFVEKHVFFWENGAIPLKAGLVWREVRRPVISRAGSDSMQTSREGTWGGF